MVGMVSEATLFQKNRFINSIQIFIKLTHSYSINFLSCNDLNSIPQKINQSPKLKYKLFTESKLTNNMGTCACFYSSKLQKYKHLYPVSTKLQSNDPRLNDPQFLRQEIKKLDFIIKHQNFELAKLSNQTDKLRLQPKNQKKVLNNSKKLFLMTKNGLLCRHCIETYDTNKIPVDELVLLEGICGKCKGDGLIREQIYVKSKQCGKCDRFFQYLWKIQLCSVCNGVGMFYTQENNPYSTQNDQNAPEKHQELAKKY